MSTASPPVGRWASRTALAAAAFMVLMVVLAGAFTPGYRHTSMFISELGARGAPLELAVRFAGFLPAGLLLLSFLALAYRGLPRTRGTTAALAGLAVYAVGYLVSAPFPCDPGCRPVQPSASQLIHNTVGLAGYLLAPLCLFALGRAARTWHQPGLMPLTGYLSAAGAAAGMLTLDPASPWVGLSQRLIEGAVLAWVLMAGAWLRREAR
jgi:hypothetical protein